MDSFFEKLTVKVIMKILVVAGLLVGAVLGTGTCSLRASAAVGRPQDFH